MSCWNKDELEQMLEDVINALDLSDSVIAEHGPMGTPPAELVAMVLAQKDATIRNLRAGFVDAQPNRLDGRTERKAGGMNVTYVLLFGDRLKVGSTRNWEQRKKTLIRENGKMEELIVCQCSTYDIALSLERLFQRKFEKMNVNYHNSGRWRRSDWFTFESATE